MKKKLMIGLLVVIFILFVIYVVPKLFSLTIFKNIEPDFDFREKKHETIQKNKEFLDYTFNGEEWQYDFKERSYIGLPSGKETFYTEYIIKYKNKYSEDKIFKFDTIGNQDFERVVYSYAVRDVNEEIKKHIAQNQENIEFTTEIILIENNNLNILDLQTGIKLYDIYEFFGRKANEDDLSIHTKINYYTDKEQEISTEYFEQNKEELIKKVKDILKEKMNTDKFEFDFELNITESPEQVII